MQTVLTINGGSSSLKCALFKTEHHQESPIYQFKLGNILDTPRISVADGEGNKLTPPKADFTNIPQDKRHAAALKVVLDWLCEQAPHLKLTAFGHRVVHGGERFSEPARVDTALLDALEKFVPLAPLHQPFNLLLIRACQELAPELPQIACFDTMFHVGQPSVERHYALPRHLTEAGIQRYGFHGLSYEFIRKSLATLSAQALTAKTVICHLGAGASMCAMSAGKSVASTMGFTAVDGLPMGSRCGNIDPGVILHLQQHLGMSLKEVERLIYKESGWLGVSGISSDMLSLHQADSPAAEEAIEMFTYRAALEVGRLAAAMGGIEQLVFTGGVGENDADVRRRIMARCEWLGLSWSAAANQSNSSVISEPTSTIMVRVIPTNEEAMIAHHVVDVIGD